MNQDSDDQAGDPPRPDAEPAVEAPGQALPGFPTPASGGQAQFDAAAAAGQAGTGHMTPASQAYYSYPQTGYGQQPGYGPPGYGPPGYGPPGYGPPGYGPPGYGPPPAFAGQPIRAPKQSPAFASSAARLGARAIDWLILGVITAPFWGPVWKSFFSQLGNLANQYPAGTNLAQVPAARTAILHIEGRLAGHMLLVLVAYCLISLAYDWIQHGQWGQTIGKRAVGIIVVSSTDGSMIGTAAAGRRASVYALPSILPVAGWVFGLLNELWLLWDPSRQCVHDKAAHTVVINKSYLAAQPRQAAG